MINLGYSIRYEAPPPAYSPNPGAYGWLPNNPSAFGQPPTNGVFVRNLAIIN